MTTTDPPRTSPSSGDESRRVQRALTQIRREGVKVAVIYGTIDAALVTLLVNLLLTVTGPGVVPSQVRLPHRVIGFVREVGGVTIADPTISSGVIIGIAVGVVVFLIELLVRVRQPLVEQFEAANPALHEALRTARDTLDDGSDSRIAPRLYEDVLTTLRGASSIGLVNLRRVTVTVVLVLVLSVATIHVAVVDLSLPGFGNQNGQEPGNGPGSEYDGLQDGSAILGDPEDIPGGEDNLDAIIDTGGTGSGDGSGTDSAAAYDSSGYVSETIETQRAEFTESERIEDAELIREYNLRIREDGDTS